MNPKEKQETSNYLDEEKPLLNYKRIWFRVQRYWYFVLLSLVLSGSVAYLFNRYSEKIYSVSASIIIKESEEAGQTAELLYNNPLINSYRNFLNEVYIIKSFPLLQNVVDTLGLSVAIYRKGNIKTSELYKTTPIKISGNKQGDQYLTGNYDLELLGNNKYRLVAMKQLEDDNGDLLDPEIYHGILNDTMMIDEYPIIISGNKLIQPEEEKLLVSFKDGLTVARGYSSKLNAEWAEEGASVVDLSLSGSVAQKELDFLEELINAYTRYDLNNKKQAASNSKRFIDQQLSYISDSLLLVEMQLERFKDQNTPVDLSVEGQRILFRIDELEKNKSTFLIKENYFNYLLGYLKKDNSLDQIVLPLSIGVSDPLLGSLIGQMTELQLRAKMMGSTTSQENPLKTNLGKQISDLRSAILESVKSLQQSDAIILKQTNRELHLYEKQLESLPRQERQLATIKRTYKLGENLYVFLTQKRTEAAISEASTISDIMVVNPPVSSAGLVSPKPDRNYLMALVLGFGFPIGIFIILELLNTRLQSKEDIEQVTNIPIIGVIGHNSDPNRMVVSNKPKSALAEAFRSLRSNLNYFVKKDQFVMMITSSISGEGKSFTTLNLANILALSGKKTIILGADMRKPRLFQEMNLSNSVGLSNFLSNQMTWQDTVQETDIDNLSIITSGPVPPNPGELLLRGEFSSLIEELKNAYDVILIDTPPIGIVADALEVAPLVDHTLFIARQNYTPKEAITSIQNHVSQGKLKNISLVFNDIYKFGPGYGYGYGSGYGYGYGYGRKNSGGGYYEDV